LNFTVIINPDSGPGSTDYPDVDYTAAVEKLSTYGNALMVGYVRTGYATRNISTVIAEVDNYAGWSSNSSALTMHGIFFDEAPYNYSEQAVDFMQTVNQVVKNSTGLHTPRLVSAPLFRALYASVLLDLSRSVGNWQNNPCLASAPCDGTISTGANISPTPSQGLWLLFFFPWQGGTSIRKSQK
jgi:hypothetical protein